MKTRNKILLGAANVLLAAGLIRIMGLWDWIYFNKSFLSAALFLLTVEGSGRTAAQMKENGRKGRTAFFLSWLLCFTEILGASLRLLENQGGVTITVGTVAWMAGAAFGFSWILEPFFFWLLGIRWQPKAAGKRSLNQVFFLCWAVLFVGWLPCFFAFYPGLYCYDLIWQWQMFASGSYSTHHSLIHTLFSGGVIELGKILFGSYERGLALHSLVQMLLLTGAMAFSLRYLAKIRVPRAVWLLIAGFYLLFPFFPVSGISTTKDILFGGLMLVVFVCLSDMVRERKIYRGLPLAGFLVVLILMGLFRNNAVYGIAFLVACLLLWALAVFVREKKKDEFLLKLALIFAVGILGMEGGFIGLKKGLDAQQGSVAEMLSMPMQQMARTYVYHQEEMDENDLKELFSFIPEDNLSRYKYYVSDPVKSGTDQAYLEENLGEFVKLWVRLGLQFPGEYLLAPVYNMMGLWYLGGDSSCYVEYQMSQPFDQEHAVETRSLLPGLKEVYSWFTDIHLQTYLPMVSMVFYTSFYVWMVLLAGAESFGRGEKKTLVLPLFLGGYILTLALGPCITVRYLLGVMMAAPVLLIQSVMLPERQKKKTPGEKSGE